MQLLSKYALLSLFLVLSVYWFSQSESLQKTNSPLPQSSIQTREDSIPTQVTEVTQSPIKKNEGARIEGSTVEKREALPAQYEEDFVDQALAGIEDLKQLPGARELVEEIILELQDNPRLINFEHMQVQDDGVELNDEFMQKMIPNPEFRHKWMKLMSIISENSSN